MEIYEYKARTITDAKLDEAPYLHSAMKLGANIVRDLVQEENVIKKGVIVQEGEFTSVKIGPSAFSSDKTEIDATAIYFLTRITYLPSESLILFTKDNQRVFIYAAVCGQNSPSGLEGRVSVVGEEEVLKRYSVLMNRCPKIKLYQP